MFFQHLYSKISSEPTEVALEICNKIDSTVSNSSTSLNNNQILLLEAGKILNSMIQNKLIKSDATLPPINNGKPVQAIEFYRFVLSVRDEVKKNQAIEESIKYETEIDRLLLNSINGQFCYELTSGDLLRIPDLLDQLEKAINESSDLSDDHKSRLAKRINKVRSELDKKLTTLDELYCLAIEAQMVAQKYGKPAALIYKAGHTLWETALRTHAQAEGLATGSTPLLTNDEGPSSFIEQGLSE